MWSLTWYNVHRGGNEASGQETRQSLSLSNICSALSKKCEQRIREVILSMFRYLTWVKERNWKQSKLPMCPFLTITHSHRDTYYSNSRDHHCFEGITVSFFSYTFILEISGSSIFFPRKNDKKLQKSYSFRKLIGSCVFGCLIFLNFWLCGGHHPTSKSHTEIILNYECLALDWLVSSQLF